MIYQKYPEGEEKMIFHPDRGYIRKYGDFCEGTFGFPEIRYLDDHRIQRQIHKH